MSCKTSTEMKSINQCKILEIIEITEERGFTKLRKPPSYCYFIPRSEISLHMLTSYPGM